MTLGIRAAVLTVAVLALTACVTTVGGSPSPGGQPGTGTAQPTAAPSERTAPTSEAGGGAPGALDACGLLTEEAAEAAIEGRADLSTSSTPGTSECLYQGADANGRPYAVDLDLSEGSPAALASNEAGYRGGGLETTPEPALGAGAFSALNITSASLSCIGNATLFDITVTAPPFPPDDVEANAEIALTGARTLGASFCG
jgi:hypothetical protein